MPTYFIGRSSFVFRKLIISLMTLLLSVFLLSIAFVDRTQAAADTCTWTGNISNDMNDANNWTGCDGFGIPESGDSYIFPESANNKDLSIDSFAVDPFSMSFTGTGYSLNRTGSETLEFIGSGVAIEAEEDVDVNVPVTFGDGSLQNTTLRAATDKRINLNSTVTFNTGIGEINVGTAGYDGGVFFNGAISGSTSQFIAQNGAYAEITSSGNTYTASTVGAESTGSFRCDDTSCFGNSSNDIYAGGGAVGLLTGGTYSNDIVTSTPTADVSSVEAFQNTTLTGDITVSSDLRFTIAVLAPTTLEIEAPSTITIDDDQTLGLLGPDADTADIEVSANIQGIGDGIAVSGATAILSGANTFDGGVDVGPSGVLVARGTTTALGDSSFSTTVSDGGVIEIDQMGVSATLDWPLILSGDGPDGDGSMVLNSDSLIDYTGDIILTDPVTIANNGGGTSELNLSGEISGTGDLTFTSDVAGGTISMAGSATNSYSGTTTVLGTRLELAKTGGLGVTGLLDVTAVGSVDAYVFSGNNGGDQIADYSIITLTNASGDTGEAFFESSNQDEVIGTIIGDGHIESDGSSYGFTLGGENTFGTFSGSFDDEDGVITKIGSDYWELDASVSYPGNPASPFSIVIEEGSVIWDASLQDMPVIIDGGKLNGSGDTGNLLASTGTLAPGSSPGCIFTGETSLNSGSTFDVELNGTTACTGFDQLVAEDVVINSAILNVDIGYAPADGTKFTIIDSGTVSGSFLGLSDGATFEADGYRLSIDYQSEAVVLTVLSSTSAGTGSLPSTGSQTLDIVIGAVLMLIAGAGLGFVLQRRRRFHYVYN